MSTKPPCGDTEPHPPHEWNLYRLDAETYATRDSEHYQCEGVAATRTVHLELAVTVPADVSDDFVASQVNITLGERYWGAWRLSKGDALDRISSLLREADWDYVTCDAIARIVRETGRDYREPDDIECGLQDEEAQR